MSDDDDSLDGGPEQAALDLPDEVILGVHERYARAYQMLCGGDE